jgi:prolipoprotein diacylglyceryl transferase
MFGAISYPPIPLFDVGPLTLSLHGLFAALGFGAGAWIASRALAKRGFDTLKYQSVLTWALVGALVGARYSTSPAALLDGASLVEALRPLPGNFSIMGGFLGGIIGGVWQMRRTGLSVWPTLDTSTTGLALGTLVGRIGDLAIVEHLGRATNVAWGYGVKPGYDLAPQHNGLECTEATAGLDGLCGVYHHVAAYDLIGAGILLWVLFFLYRRYQMRYGQLFFVWVIWYGLQRFVLDFLRFGMGDSQIGPYTWNQVSGLAAAVGGAILFWYMGRSQPEVDAEEDERRGASFAEAEVSEGS